MQHFEEKLADAFSRKRPATDAEIGERLEKLMMPLRKKVKVV